MAGGTRYKLESPIEGATKLADVDISKISKLSDLQRLINLMADLKYIDCEKTPITGRSNAATIGGLKSIQEFLVKEGYPVKVDGERWGPAKAALNGYVELQKYQSMADLKADDIKTKEGVQIAVNLMVREGYIEGPKLLVDGAIGKKSKEGIKKMQDFLSVQGYGAIATGIFDKRTREALEQFVASKAVNLGTVIDSEHKPVEGFLAPGMNIPPSIIVVEGNVFRSGLFGLHKVVDSTDEIIDFIGRCNKALVESSIKVNYDSENKTLALNMTAVETRCDGSTCTNVPIRHTYAISPETIWWLGTDKTRTVLNNVISALLDYYDAQTDKCKEFPGALRTDILNGLNTEKNENFKPIKEFNKELSGIAGAREDTTVHRKVYATDLDDLDQIAGMMRKAEDNGKITCDISEEGLAINISIPVAIERKRKRREPEIEVQTPGYSTGKFRRPLKTAVEYDGSDTYTEKTELNYTYIIPKILLPKTPIGKIAKRMNEIEEAFKDYGLKRTEGGALFDAVINVSISSIRQFNTDYVSACIKEEFAGEAPASKPEQPAQPALGAPEHEKKVKIVLYYGLSCGWCKKAEKWLKDNGYEFEAVRAGDAIMEDERVMALFKRFYPNIDVDGQYGIPVIVIGNWAIKGFSAYDAEQMIKDAKAGKASTASIGAKDVSDLFGAPEKTAEAKLKQEPESSTLPEAAHKPTAVKEIETVNAKNAAGPYRIVMFIRDNCAGCDELRQRYENKGFIYTYVHPREVTGDEVLDAFGSFPRSFPQTLILDKYGRLVTRGEGGAIEEFMPRKEWRPIAKSGKGKGISWRDNPVKIKRIDEEMVEIPKIPAIEPKTKPAAQALSSASEETVKFIGWLERKGSLFYVSEDAGQAPAGWAHISKAAVSADNPYRIKTYYTIGCYACEQLEGWMDEKGYAYEKERGSTTAEARDSDGIHRGLYPITVVRDGRGDRVAVFIGSFGTDNEMLFNFIMPDKNSRPMRTIAKE